MKWLHVIAFALVLAGGLNWGLVGFFNYNLVESLFGVSTGNWVYMLVGLSTVYVAFTHKSDCKICSKM
jgi:uncharacterized protein